MTDDSMPPRPDCEFDFQLPHATGMESLEDTVVAQHSTQGDTQESNSMHASTGIRNHDNDYSFMGRDLHDLSPDDHHNYDPVTEELLQAVEHSKGFDSYGQDNDDQDMGYGILPKGYSDDEDADESFDRSWTYHRALKPTQEAKKSPRRSDEDEMSPKTKKPRQSLFGGPVEDDSGDQPETSSEDQNIDVLDVPIPGQGIRHRMSSLSLEQQEREDSHSERPFHLGFGFASSDRACSSPRLSRAASEESRIAIPPDDQPIYGLRQNIERKNVFTYIDTDKSGNFDPTEEAKQKVLKLRAKAAKAAQLKKKGKQQAIKDNVMKCIVKLRFRAFGNVRNYTNDEDNWPKDWSDIDSDCEREMEHYRAFFRHNTPGREIQRSIEDPSGELDDLTGYPAARGCRSCRKHGDDCSLVEGGTYPCVQCIDDGNGYVCEPIQPPTIKGRCKQCLEDGNGYCSFEDDAGQAICDYCADNEFICDALPPPGYRADRIIIDEVIYGKDRPYASCTVCRQEKKRCSLKKKTDRPPCKYCKKHNIGCTFFDLPKIDIQKPGRVMGPTEGDAPEVAMPGSAYFTAEDLEDMMFGMPDEKPLSRSPTPEIEMEDGVGHRGVLTKIKTSFAHPIQFNVSATGKSECEFCEIPLFGVIGHFEREVHVIRWYNGLGFSEVGGGHCEHKGPTKMCEDCTITRLQTIACPGHELQPMPDDVESAQKFELATDELLCAEPGSTQMKYELQRWCSLCFSLATVGCATPQPSICGEEEIVIPGCGLRLCARCDLALKESFQGDLDLLASEMDRMPKMSVEDEHTDWHGRARADVGFLRREGLLMRHFSEEG